MKLKNIFNLIALGAALTISGAGCRHTPTGPTPIGSNKTGIKNPNGMGGENNNGTGVPISRNPNGGPNAYNATGGGDLPPAGSHDHWNEDTQSLKGQTVYFDYDKSAVKASEQSKLDAVASYLRSHPQAAIRVEGNCDERGTDEYNRSLGQRRALASREKLVQSGIDPNRIETISYGKDRPVEPAQTESAFSKNRRDDFVVLTPPGR